MTAVTTPHMRRATIDGHQLAYRERGRGTPLILVHGGFAADLLSGFERAEALAGCRRVLYHRQGYGESPRPELVAALTLADQAEDVLGLVDHLGLGAAHLVGHSYGALVALTAAATRPAAIASLTLLEPPVPFSHPAAASWLEAVAPLAERYAGGDVAGAVSGFYDATLEAGWRERMDAFAPGAFDDSVAGAPMAFESDLPGLDWTDGLGAEQVAAIRCPVLAVIGTRTRPVFLEADDVVRGWFPWREHVEISGADHMLPVLETDRVAGEVAAFVQHAANSGAMT